MVSSNITSYNFLYSGTLSSFNARIRDINQVICSQQLGSLATPHLDEVLFHVTDAIEIAQVFNIDTTNSGYPRYSSLINDLIRINKTFQHKYIQIKNILQLLNKFAFKHNINYDKLTKQYNNKIHSLMIKCERVRVAIFEDWEIKSVDCNTIIMNSTYFPNISSIFNRNWLEKECGIGFPYHVLVIWLSRFLTPLQLEQTINEIDTESNEIEKIVKTENLRKLLMTQTRLNHLENCLGLLKNKEQGRGKIIDGLKDGSNFFQYLSHLEVALSLSRSGYEISFEEPSANGRYIDILASKNGIDLVLEIVTLDESSELRYSGFSADIKDKAKTKMLEKLKQFVDYAKGRSGPIILVMNMSYAPDQDMHGILYALNGVNIHHLVFEDGHQVDEKRYTTFERDPQFTNLKGAPFLSAVLYYYSDVHGTEINLSGGMILNKLAQGFDKKVMNDIKNTMFKC